MLNMFRNTYKKIARHSLRAFLKIISIRRVQMRLSRVLIALFCSVVIAGIVYAGMEKGEESLNKLMDGNKRFV